MKIATTHVGSLIRPDALLDLADEALVTGETTGEYVDCLRRSVDEVVAKQAQIGIDIVSDGEFSKSSWIGYLYNRLSGLEDRRDQAGEQIAKRMVSRDREEFPEAYADELKVQMGQVRPSTAAFSGVVEPLKYVGQEAIQRDIDDLMGAMERAGGDVQGFLPVVAPASAAFFMIDEHYGDDEALAFGIAEALREEYRAIVDSGLYLQVDDAALAHEMDSILVRGGTVDDYKRWAQIQVNALNYALEGLPEDRVRYHVCWGSWHGPHTSDPELRDIVDFILQVNAGGYSIEQANVRHEHEWEVWRDVRLPEGRKLLPGVVTHSTPLVEHPELVAQRLVRLADVVGAENVIASTDCGFAQGGGIQRVHPTVQWAKLESLVQGAGLASQRV